MLRFFLLILCIFCLEASLDQAKGPLASLITVMDQPEVGFQEDEIDHLFKIARADLTESEDHFSLDNALDLYHANDFESASFELCKLWQKEEGTFSDFDASYPHFSDNRLFGKKEKKETERYLLPLNSPLKSTVDALFATRVIRDRDSLVAAGFEIIASRPRSFILVAKHPTLPGYVFKIFLDNLLEKKGKIPGWKWLIYRCKGARAIAKLIAKKKLTHLAVPKKWIYPLEKDPGVPQGYDQKHTILIAQEMPLVPKDINHALWESAMTKQHVEELFIVISRLASVRARPDNVWFLPDGRLALIDTEYYNKKPDLVTIRQYLTPELRDYWDKLVRQGGK